MDFQQYIISEDLKRLGKLKLHKPHDPTKSFKFKMARGQNRKTLTQVPASQSSTQISDNERSLSKFIRGMNISNKAVDVAKRAPSGVWRVSAPQASDIAKKYKFYVPNDAKPMKHLGSTGIQLIQLRPGVFYLYKPRKRHKRKKSIRKGSHFSIPMATFG